MPSGGRTRIIGTLLCFMIFVGTPAGSLPTVQRGAFTCRSGFSDNTDICRPFPDLLPMFVALNPEDVVVAFQDSILHVLSQADRGRQIAADQWRCRKGYIAWFYSVSHPIMSDHAPIAEYPAPIPPYEEVIFQEKYARQVPDPLQIIGKLHCQN